MVKNPFWNTGVAATVAMASRCLPEGSVPSDLTVQNVSWPGGSWTAVTSKRDPGRQESAPAGHSSDSLKPARPAAVTVGRYEDDGVMSRWSIRKVAWSTPALANWNALVRSWSVRAVVRPLSTTESVAVRAMVTMKITVRAMITLPPSSLRIRHPSRSMVSIRSPRSSSSGPPV